jgi:hypothetical protein
MNAGVHCSAVLAAPNGVGSGNAAAVCMELRPSLSEIRHHPGCGTVDATVTETGCPGWNTFTVPVAEVPVDASFPQGGVFCGDPSPSWVHQFVGALSMKCASAADDAETMKPPSTVDTASRSSSRVCKTNLRK